MTPSRSPGVTEIPPAEARETDVEPVRLRHRILRAGGWAAAGFAIDKLLAAIQLTIVARILTPADFGVMAASAAVLLATITISELGLDQALIAKGEVNEDDLTTVWTLSLGRGVLMAVCLWAGSGLVAEWMQMPSLAALLRVHAWALVLQGAQNPVMTMFVKTLDLRRRVTVDVIRRAVEATVTVGLAVTYRNVWALVIGQLVSMAVGTLLSFWVAPIQFRWSLPRTSIAYFLRYGRHLNVTTLCAFGVMTAGDFVIARIQGPAALGFYQVALAIPLLIGARATALMQQIAVPTYATLQRDRLGIARVFDLQMGLVGLLYIPLAVILTALAPVIVPLLFGPQWIGIVDAFRILCLYAVCAGYASVTAALHYGMGRADLQTKSWVGQCALYAAMIVPMTFHFGVIGAAISLTTSYLLGVVLQGIATRKLIGPSADATFWSLGRTGLVVGLLAGGLLAVAQLQSGAALPWLVAPACAAGLGLFGWYVWWVEFPRLKGLWEYQSQGAGV